MRVLIHGGGWYGCHIAIAMHKRGHDVRLQDRRGRLFGGASGANPARLHMGYHYPRSAVTRHSCQEHNAAFLLQYGSLSRSVEVNHYAIAENDSLMDFRTYVQVLRSEAPLTEENPADFGYRCIEGVIRVPERHLVIRVVREYFERELTRLGIWTGCRHDMNAPDLLIDCTFCAGSAAGIARYEPCVMGLLEGPTHRALTVMDGPFPSIYPWDELQDLSSLTSASLTPLARCATYEEAEDLLRRTSVAGALERAEAMLDQMARYWPAARDVYKLVDVRTGIRAQPMSAADSRYCSIDFEPAGDRWDHDHVTVRPGKIDSVLVAEREILKITEACE